MYKYILYNVYIYSLYIYITYSWILQIFYHEDIVVKQ